MERVTEEQNKENTDHERGQHDSRRREKRDEIVDPRILMTSCKDAEA
jgi:hypothetical protein